jgi:hypothetical protein
MNPFDPEREDKSLNSKVMAWSIYGNLHVLDIDTMEWKIEATQETPK